MSIKSLNLLILSGLFFGATVSFASPKIVGGTLVEASDPIAKTTVAIYLQDKDKKGSICTGSLISNDMLVTAAHCLDGNVSAYVFFTLDVNAPDALKTETIRQVTAVEKLKNYNATAISNRNDMAFMQFAGGLPAGYEPAKLLDKASSEIAVRVGAKVAIAGYGITSGKAKDQGALRKTEVSVYSVSGNQTEVLVASPGHSACHGDSGGPAFVMIGDQPYLWGVTSRGNEDCSFSLYTKIQAYL